MVQNGLQIPLDCSYAGRFFIRLHSWGVSAICVAWLLLRWILGEAPTPLKSHSSSCTRIAQRAVSAHNARSEAAPAAFHPAVQCQAIGRCRIDLRCNLSAKLLFVEAGAFQYKLASQASCRRDKASCSLMLEPL